FVGQPPWADKKLQPAWPLALRINFSPAEEIALRDNTDNMTVAVYDRQAADPVQKHEVRRLEDRCLRLNRNDVACHDMSGFHHESPGRWALRAADSAAQLKRPQARRRPRRVPQTFTLIRPTAEGDVHDSSRHSLSAGVTLG